MLQIILLAACLTAVSAVCSSSTPTHYAFDGCGNNVDHVSWGAANQDFLRLQTTHAYSDANNYDGMNFADRPSARAISRDLLLPPYKSRKRNRRYGTDMLTYIGQFISHDIDSRLEGTDEQEDILVPECDEFYDVACTSTQTLPFYRSGFNSTISSKRDQINTVTSYLDGSVVYGSTSSTANKLRANFKGFLSTSNGQLPTNYMNLDMANPPQIESNYDLRAAGDSHVNSSPILLAIQSIFVREHNRLAESIYNEHKDWSDDDIFYEARKWIIAYIQSICYYEYLPMIGIQLPPYVGYSKIGNSGVDNLFATVAQRYGISEVMDIIYRIDDNGYEIPAGHLLMKDSFYQPTQALSAGIDSLIRGASFARQAEVQPFLSASLQNYLYGTPRSGGSDLLAITIQRGRDHGIPDYNTVRQSFQLPPKTSFSDITSDLYLQEKLQEIYGSVDKIDAFVGGISEDSYMDSSVGELFYFSIINQFERIRNHDRFYFENTKDGPFADSPTKIKEIRATSLRDIIMRNSDIKTLPMNIFVQDIKEPWPRSSAQVSTPPMTTPQPIVRPSSPSPPPSSPPPTPVEPPKNVEENPQPVEEPPEDPPEETNEPTIPDEEPAASVIQGETVIDADADYVVGWTLDSDSITMTLSIKGTGFAGIGIPGETLDMQSADIIAMAPDDQGGCDVKDYWAITFMDPGLDTSDGGSDDIQDKTCEIVDGYMKSSFKRLISTGDPKDRDLPASPVPFIYAHHPDSNGLIYHGPMRRGLVEVEMVASPVEEPELEQETTPSEPTDDTKEEDNNESKNEEKGEKKPRKPSKSLITMHAWLMTISWCILCVIGLLMSRLTRHWKHWMEIHMACEFGATTLSMVGEIFSFTYSEGNIRYAHGGLSFAILVVSVPQVFFGWMIYNSVSSKHKKLHRGMGYFLAGVAFWQMWSGMKILVVDERLEQIFFAWLIAIMVSFHFASEAVTKEEMFQSLVKRGFMSDDVEQGNSPIDKSNDGGEGFLASKDNQYTPFYHRIKAKPPSNVSSFSASSIKDKANKMASDQADDMIPAYMSKNESSPTSKGITTKDFIAATQQNKPWTLIEGKVYNMQDLLSTHPGGSENIVDIIGKDGTELYMEHHAESDSAHQMLQETLLGDLID